MLSNAAFNALLKTLEEPPPHAIFVLATTEIHKIPATVLSRCQRHEFRRVPVDEIVGQLKRIAAEEKMTVDDDALTLIARQSAGGMRDAISLLDQLSSTGDKIDLTLTQTVLGTAASQTVLDLVESVKDQKPAPAMDAIHTALDAGADPRSLARQIVDYLRGLMLIQMGNADQVEVTKDIKKKMAEHAGAFSMQDILRMMKAFNTAAVDTRGGWQPSLSLELAVAEVLAAPAGASRDKEEQKTSKVKKSKPVVQTAEEKPEKVTSTPTPAAKIESGKETAKRTKDTVSAEARAKTESPAINLANVVDAWRDIRSVIKPDHPGIEALLNSCKLLEVRGNELYLGFQSETVRALMDVEEKLEITRAAITEILGVDLFIKCIVTHAKGQLPPDVNPNGMVATAIQNGGEIVDVQD